MMFWAWLRMYRKRGADLLLRFNLWRLKQGGRWPRRGFVSCKKYTGKMTIWVGFYESHGEGSDFFPPN